MPANLLAEALKKVQNSLAIHGLALKIYDAYRPYAATLRFYEMYPDTNFVANPVTVPCITADVPWIFRSLTRQQGRKYLCLLNLMISRKKPTPVIGICLKKQLPTGLYFFL